MVIITETENQTRTHPLFPGGTGTRPSPVAFIAADESRPTYTLLWSLRLTFRVSQCWEAVDSAVPHASVLYCLLS